MKISAVAEKNFLAVIIILISFALLYFFVQNQNFLTDSNNIPIYVDLTAVALILLLILFFMVCARADKVKSSSKFKKKK